MMKFLLRSVLACGLAAAAMPALAQGACARADLQKVADSYVEAQKTGDPGKLPLGLWVQYYEQGELSNFYEGIISKPLKVDFSRALLDTQGCAAVVEAVVTDPAHPYVLAVRLQARGDSVNEIAALVTDKEDWLFNAANTLKYAQAEKWTEIPEGERDTRQVIKAAADAYLDSFNDKNVTVPWGSPCARLEGGLYTAKGAPGVVSPEDSCNVGVPSGQKLVDRSYVIDEALGAVSVFLTFGNNQLPDAHTFRVEKGKIRYVHTVTVCKTFNCGFKVPEQLQTSAK
jgi:hypothetical protein